MDRPYALVDDAKTVINIVLWNGGSHAWQPPAGCRAVLITNPAVAIGWTYSNGQFEPPK